MKRKTCASYNLLQVDTAILYYQSTEAAPQAGPDQILSYLPPRHNKTTTPLSFLGMFGSGNCWVTNSFEKYAYIPKESLGYVVIEYIGTLS